MAGSTVATTVGFVGAGRLGATLASALVETGSRVAAVASRHLPGAQALAAALGSGVEFTTDAGRIAAACDLVFLTVPDAAIAPTCRSIAWEPRHLVVHCSGALGLDALAGVTAAGGIAGCLHPLQSFPSRSPEPERLRGIFCGVEGAEPLAALLEQMVTGFGAQPFRLEGVDRTLYHAAAVFVSNHVVALASAAGRLWTLAGLPEPLARQALSPLLLAASANVAALELRDALTGPVARGDVATVEAHLRALAADPALRELYRALSAELLRLPLVHEPASGSQLRGLLEDGDSSGSPTP
jgi:predicted short-subunit dehydrogenase-like oxidoreductase (DUF2520 family)